MEMSKCRDTHLFTTATCTGRLRMYAVQRNCVLYRQTASYTGKLCVMQVNCVLYR